VRHVRVPYTVALVLTGLALGAWQGFPAPHLTKELLFGLFLPGLVFEAAFALDSREFRVNWLTIASLAVPGVIASMALTAWALTPVVQRLPLGAGFTWKEALVFGALISATDPVAVVALFRTLRVPRRLTTLLDGESLLNDGTAIVFFALALALFDGTAPTGGELIARFVFIVGVGAVIGTSVGAACSWLIRHVDDPMIGIALTMIAAYGSFVTAESLHSSGVIAAVAAGMWCAGLGARSGTSASTRLACGTFWEYLVFALNSIVFLLIGLEVRLPDLAHYWLPIVIAYLAVTLSRGLVLAAGRALGSLSRDPPPWRWSLVLTWGGLRGALPMVLVLTLPQGFPFRELLVAMTFGVAVLSILVHGLTMRWLLARLGLVAVRTAAEEAKTVG
jgi:monovalent cation:H+ antiporter, CPA1 family